VIFIDNISEELLMAAGKFKAKNMIAYVDALAAATAKINNAILITGDPEFKQLNDGINILWI
jgi:predicted nucleic acid-binding protein